MPAWRLDRRTAFASPGTPPKGPLAPPRSPVSARFGPRRPVRRLVLCAACGLVALLLWPVSALAWKPVDHLYAGNLAIAPILAGRNVVVLLDRDYTVPAAVATSIRNHPDDYRGGVVGPDAFPDILGGQGNVHPDTRGANDTQPHADWTPGHSYAYEWLALVYRAGWAAYDKCDGCAEGQRDLAFTYGYLTHAGEDMWGHTFVNDFAKGVFPEVSEIGNARERNIAIRHIVTEDYVGVHTPATDLALNAPTDFIYKTFIDNPTAAVLGRGVFIDTFFKLKARLVAKVARLTDYIDSGTFKGCPWPVNWPACAESEYLKRWIDDINSGLRAYPEFSLKIARDLFGHRKADTEQLGKDITDYFNMHLVTMIGAPKFVGKLAEWFTTISRWVSDVAEPIIRPIKEVERSLKNFIVKAATGFTYDEWLDYLTRPASYINNPHFGFAADTSIRLDRLMGITRSDEIFEPSRFAAMKDTITIAKLILLNGAGLTSLLESEHTNPYFLSDVSGYPQNIMVQVSPAAVGMTGWIKSLDGDHQWTARSSANGRSYGTGSMYLWRSCNARPVFRTLFKDWEHGSENFPDSEDALPCAKVLATGPPVQVNYPPQIAPFGAPQLCEGRTCGPGELSLSSGTWTNSETVWYSYQWIRTFGPGCDKIGGCVVSASPVYRLTGADSGATLVGRVEATNEYGASTATTAPYRVRILDLSAPAVSNLIVAQDRPWRATLSLSKPAELTVTLAAATGTVPCKSLLREREGNCEEWAPVTGPGAPAGVFHFSAKGGVNVVSLDPFGGLAPGRRYQVAIQPKDQFRNVGRYASTEFLVPVRTHCVPPRRCV